MPVVPGSPYKLNVNRLLTRFCAGMLLFVFLAGQTLAQQHTHVEDEPAVCVVCSQSDTAPTLTAPSPQPRAEAFSTPFTTPTADQPLTSTRAPYLTRGPPPAS